MVYSIAGSSVASSWQAFQTFEDDFRVVTTEHFRDFVDRHLEKQPEVEYFGKRFRRRLVPNELTPDIARRELLTLPSVVVRRNHTEVILEGLKRLPAGSY